MAPKRCYSKEYLLEEFDRSMQIQRKRQKSSGKVASHEFEHFNDVTACADMDLDEEQEQLFFKAPGNKVSTSLQHCQYSVHQEEEMFVSKTFLQAKLEDIISKSGLKTVGKDVENCLLLGLGEMMERLIRNMIRMSKQRVDCEKRRHRTLVTSDIHRHIMIMHRKCQDQKKTEDEKSKKTGADLRLERAARTNKAVRASLGGDDFVSKWKLLSRKAQHEEDPGIGDQPCEKINKGSKGAVNKFQGKDTEKRTRQNRLLPVPKRVISVKDVIRTLEKEPQMSKSSFMYRLCERSAVSATNDEKAKETSA